MKTYIAIRLVIQVVDVFQLEVKVTEVQIVHRLDTINDLVDHIKYVLLLENFVFFAPLLLGIIRVNLSQDIRPKKWHHDGCSIVVVPMTDVFDNVLALGPFKLLHDENLPINMLSHVLDIPLFIPLVILADF